METYRTYWNRVMDASGCSERQRLILHLCVARDGDGSVALNDVDFVYPCDSWRSLAATLAGAGIVNERGARYHPDHLRQHFVTAIELNIYAAAGITETSAALRKRTRRVIEDAIGRRSK
jgi:hypothetical protein